VDTSCLQLLSQDLTRSQWSGKRHWIHFSPWNPKQEMISQQIRLDLDWIEYSKNKIKTSHLNKASQLPPNGSHHHQHKKISQKNKTHCSCFTQNANGNKLSLPHPSHTIHNILVSSIRNAQMMSPPTKKITSKY
jgi:hypothetical protein